MFRASRHAVERYKDRVCGHRSWWLAVRALEKVGEHSRFTRCVHNGARIYQCEDIQLVVVNDVIVTVIKVSRRGFS
jgi:hypothetical protein